jgi:hypothetical protein
MLCNQGLAQAQAPHQDVSLLGQARASLLSERDVSEVKQDLESNTSLLLACKVVPYLSFAALHSPQWGPERVNIRRYCRYPVCNFIRTGVISTLDFNHASTEQGYSESSEVCLMGYCKWHSDMIHSPV